MLSRPRLKASFRAVPLPPRHVFLLDERRPVVLEGGVFESVLPLLDGARAASLEEALGATGLTVSEPADLKIVLTADYLRPELEGLNDEALRRGRRWMLVKPVGMVPWVGPILVPGRTGCWACLAQR